ncbi:MAG: metallophosphoesterase family protein [Acetatifactor sp.]|nr:metallophosphoesterase family protein [Acetatifactor sp.]
MRYYIADLHFFHSAMNDHMDHRGFAGVEEMNEYMIARWNGKVRQNDDVVVIGDLSWGKAEETNALLRRLNGALYLILGNHDQILSDRRIDTTRFQWMKHYEELSDNKRKVVLCHYPIMCYNGQYRLDKDGKPKTYMLYGHVHDSTDQRLLERFQEMTRNTVTVNMQGEEQKIPCNMINCFCKYSDYEPLTLDEWIELDQRRRGNSMDENGHIRLRGARMQTMARDGGDRVGER